MKFLKETGLALGAMTTLFMSTGCGSDTALLIDEGNYSGTGIYENDADEDHGFLFADIVVAEDGSVYGTLEVFSMTEETSSVPDGSDTIDVEGSAEGETITFTDGEVTATGTLQEDGSLSLELTSDGGLVGFIGASTGVAGTVAVGCGYFSFIHEDEYEVPAVVMADADGNLFGVFFSSDDDVQGTMTGTFGDPQSICKATTCGNLVEATATLIVDGDTVTMESLTGDSSLDFIDEDEEVEDYSEVYVDSLFDDDGGPDSGDLSAATFRCFPR